MGNKNEKWVDPQIDPRVIEAVRKLAAQGCTGAKASPYWRMLHTPLLAPWPLARIALYHRSVPTPEVPQEPSYLLRGEGTIAEHLAALTLFSLETGYLPHNWLYVHGRDDFSGRLRLIDIGVDGFRVRRAENHALALYRHIGPGSGKFTQDFEVVSHADDSAYPLYQAR